MTNNGLNIIAGFLLTVILATQFSCGTLRNIELERNRSLWNDSKITNYKMTIKIQKTGHATPNGKFIITVRNSVAESIKMFDKPDVDMMKDSVIRFGRYSTIEGIFSFIENAENDKEKNNNFWSRRTVEYDAKFGYPKLVDMDQSGVFDDELFFQVLEFEKLADGESKVKPSPPKVISVPATEITKAEFFARRHIGSLIGSDESYTSSNGVSFSNDGTAYNYFGSKNYDTGKNQNEEGLKYQGVVSAEQFQKFAQILAENDFSNLEDSIERTTDATDYTLTITYSGKTKSIKTSNTGKDTAEIKAILDALESLKNQIDWIQIK